jgi:FMN phosphatase YigB (HAD superfamily)
MSNTMTDSVFFDFDGVLTLEARGSTVTIRTIREARPDLSASAIGEAYYQFHREMLLGREDHGSIWDEFCALVGAEIDQRVLTTVFLAPPVNVAMLYLAKEISRTCQVGIITANATDRMSALVDRYQLHKTFDPIVVSAEVGSLKTDAAIFERALRGRRPNTCVFIDNQDRNLTVAADLGFKTYLFDPERNDVAALRDQLADWGVEVNRGERKERPTSGCT